MNKQNILKFLGCLALCHGAGIIGSFFTINSIPTWYQFLNKPEFAPPNWIFAPVWLTLYTFMAIALFLIWQKGLGNRQVKMAFWVFMVQLLLNALWSIFFFGLKNPLLALVDIVFLIGFVIASIILFYQIKKSAAWLLVPYLAWITFAAVLNFYIWKLN